MLGYPSTPYSVQPFNETKLTAVSGKEYQRHQQFNKLLSSVQIDVEHAFGLLKG